MSVGSYFRNLGRALAASDDPEPNKRDPANDFWFNPVSILSAAGVAVTPDSALRVPAVFDSVKTITNPIASLPIRVFRRVDDDTKEPLGDHPVSLLFKGSANARETGVLFRGQMQWDTALRNNGVAEILRDGDGQVGALERFAPGSVQVRMSSSREPIYEVRSNAGFRTLRADQVFHLKGLPLSDDGLTGTPITDTGPGRDVIGAALALQMFASRFFVNDTRAGGVIEMPGNFNTKEDRQKFLDAWRQARTGKNAYRDAVLEFGGKYTTNEIDAQKSQMIETRKQLAIECAQLWKVPPHKIGILDKATFSNIEQQAIEFVTDTMLFWFSMWEAQIKRDLILEDDVFAEFDVLGLLRGDTKARYEAYAQARNWGWLSVNDIRRLENMDSIGPDGDRYDKPANSATTDKKPKDGAAADDTASEPPSDQPAPGARKLEVVK